MPKYRVNVCRIAFSNMDIEVEAHNKEEAEHVAENEAGSHSFPNEHTSEYQVQSVTRL
jgi:capsular polysaccharide biosynthesis protein